MADSTIENPLNLTDDDIIEFPKTGATSTKPGDYQEQIPSNELPDTLTSALPDPNAPPEMEPSPEEVEEALKRSGIRRKPGPKPEKEKKQQPVNQNDLKDVVLPTPPRRKFYSGAVQANQDTKVLWL